MTETPLKDPSAIGLRNNQIRTRGLFGPDEGSALMITPGVMDLGDEAVGQLVLKFMQFNAFDAGDDPFGDRDFGALDHFGTTVWFKIEPKEGEPDNRTITFLLPSEY